MTKISIVLWLALCIFFSCTNTEFNQDPNSDYTDGINYGDLKADTLYATADTVLKGDYVNSTLANRLSLANWDGLKSYILIKFFDLPSDTVEIDSVYITLTTINKFGSFTPDQINVDIFGVDSSWGNNVNADNYWRTYDPGPPVEQATLSLEDSAISKISIPLTLFDEWRANDEENNYGCMLKLNSSEQGFISEFAAYGTAAQPLMIYVTDSSGVFQHDTLSILQDASIYNYDETTGIALNRYPGELLVSSGVPYHAFLKFDFSSLPKNAIYYSAQLHLSSIENEYDNNLDTTTFYVRSIESASDDLSEYQIDSTFASSAYYSFLMIENYSNASMYIFGAYKKYFAQYFFQPLVNNEITNKWLYIQYVGEEEDLSVKKFYGTDSDKALQPKIIVKYFKTQSTGN